MATKFLEPGGDATFNVQDITHGGFWAGAFGPPTIVTDFVHGNHIKSIKTRGGVFNDQFYKDGLLIGAGRISFYIYLAVGSSTSTFFYNSLISGLAGTVFGLKLTSSNVLQLFEQTNQMGSDGPTLNTGQWYRISIAFTTTNFTTNEFRVFVDGVLVITASNQTLSNTGADTCLFGNQSGNLELRFSDIYVDNSNSLTDTGDIWVTAKRPNANGTTNGFSTQIGSGGSGYGTGHSPQVNERALSTTNGWSMIGAGSAVTEEYNIEGRAVGDIDISATPTYHILKEDSGGLLQENGSYLLTELAIINGINTIVDYVGWAYMSSLVGETVQMIVNGVNFAQAITSTNTMYTKVKGSTNYPAGTGADIGITTDTSLTTVSLFECGIMVAYIPGTATTILSRQNLLTLLGVS